ncbi:MAG: DUF3043 domain-containing protein [Kineosporiaceae bacterium]
MTDAGHERADPVTECRDVDGELGGARSHAGETNAPRPRDRDGPYPGSVFGRSRSSTQAEPSAESVGTAAKPASSTSESPPKPAGKGRPTPRRREAEQRNWHPVVGGGPRLSPNATKEERKAARAAQREAAAAERLKSRQALISGDERSLPPQHRGPARRFARDYVDSRWNLGEFLMPVAFVILGLGLVPKLQAFTLIAVPLLYLYLLVVVVDAFLLARRINRRAIEKFGPQAAGAGRYGAMRSAQIRRFRLPRPQVARGQHPE